MNFYDNYIMRLGCHLSNENRKIDQVIFTAIELEANAIQIFDTWGGILSQDDFQEFSLQYVEKIISNIKRDKEPVIFFPKGVHSNLEKVANCGADVLGLDWTMDLGKVRALVGDKVALQGNLDPTTLYGSEEVIKDRALKTMQSYGNGSGHIFNLGHGILPDVQPEKLKTLVNFVCNQHLNKYQTSYYQPLKSHQVLVLGFLPHLVHCKN